MKTKVFQIMCALALLVFWMGGCAILQRETPEKKAREVMMAFQQSLTQPDDEILKFFESEQSRESLLSAIDILQNQVSELVTCIADFDKMSLEIIQLDESLTKILKDDKSVVRVTIPTRLTPRTSGEASEQIVNLSFLLTEKADKFIIYKLEGDDFYSAFTSLKHDIQYASDRHAEVKEREAIYELARSLEEKFDSLVWYAQYKGKVYFYAVMGAWNEEALYPQSSVPKPDYKMGLIDETGKEIIPIAFDMIGTLGAEQENAVEVKSPEGYGYFSLDGDTLVSPEFDQIIPYPQGDVWIVQSAGQYGYVDNRGKYAEGFINATAKQYIEDFAYLPSEGTINESNYALCESPRHEGAGTGHFISPSYYVAIKLFEPIQFGFTTTASDVPIGGWTEYVEFGAIFKNISDGVGVIVASFKERYLEGREEFYEHTDLKFIGETQDVLFAEAINSESVDVKKISEELIELTITENRMYFEMSGMDGQVLNPVTYRYYQVAEGSVSPLESRRVHLETEFVKMDDSYITGSFQVFNESIGSSETVSSLPVSTLEFMRNEILAEYGMTFQDEETRSIFENQKWYSARYQNETEFAEALSEIDRHNLDFLAKAIGARKEPEGDV